MTLEFSRQIKKNNEILNSTKIRPLGAELFHVEGRTDGRTDTQTDEQTRRFAFLNFANAPKKEKYLMVVETTSAQNFPIKQTTLTNSI